MGVVRPIILRSIVLRPIILRPCCCDAIILLIRPYAARHSSTQMRVTVCELPHEPKALDAAWAALCEHTAGHASELVLLPELAMVEPVWELEKFDAARWMAVENLACTQLRRLPELRADYVVGTRPVRTSGRSNQGFLWSVA